MASNLETVGFDASIEQAQRARTVARSIADLNFVHSILDADLTRETGVFFADPSKPRENIYVSSREILYPYIDMDGNSPRLTGFGIHDSFPHGGLDSVLRFDPSLDDKAVLIHDEWAPGTMTVDLSDELSISALSPLEIARSEVSTGIFAAKAAAAFSLLKTTPKMRARFERRAKRLARF